MDPDLDPDLAQKQSIFTENGPFLCRIRIFLRIRIHIFKTEYCNFDQFLEEPDPDPYIWIQLDPDPQKKYGSATLLVWTVHCVYAD